MLQFGVYFPRQFFNCSVNHNPASGYWFAALFKQAYQFVYLAQFLRTWSGGYYFVVSLSHASKIMTRVSHFQIYLQFF